MSIQSIIINKNLIKNLDLDETQLTSRLKEYIEDFSKGFDTSEIYSDSNKKKILANLRKSYTAGRLTLVLGAGVSIDYGLPSWNTLLQTLLARTFKKEKHENGRSLIFAEVFNNIFGPNALVAARYLSGQFESGSLQFEKEVRKLLYGQIKPDFSSDLMKELVQLCAAPGKSPNLDSIITYNYDDILEIELNKASIKVPYKSIFKIGQNPKQNELPIYHVHGYIPSKGNLTEENQITLGEDLYHQQYTNIYNWQNLTQLNKFKDSSCIFIGSSLSDPNQRRLLDIANIQRGKSNAPEHFIIKPKYSLESIKRKLKYFLDNNTDVFSKKESAGIDFDELSKIMIDAVHKFEVNDASSLGVETIWVESYQDIPEILQNMRK